MVYPTGERFMSTIFFLPFFCNVSYTSIHLDSSMSSKENCILSKNVLIFLEYWLDVWLKPERKYSWIGLCQCFLSSLSSFPSPSCFPSWFCMTLPLQSERGLFLCQCEPGTLIQNMRCASSVAVLSVDGPWAEVLIYFFLHFWMSADSQLSRFYVNKMATFWQSLRSASSSP